MSGAASLSISPRASLSLILLVGMLVTLAVASVLVSLPSPWSWGVGALIAASSAVRVAPLVLRPAARLRFGPEARLDLLAQDGGSLAGTVGPRRFVSRFILILPWAGPTRRRYLLLAADMVDAEAFRRARLWALWGRIPAGGRFQVAQNGEN